MKKLQILADAKTNKIILDANILMCGADCVMDTNYSFIKMKECYLDSIFTYFNDILIHEAVWLELGEERRNFIHPFIGHNVTIVGENGLYTADPHYNTIFNAVAGYDLFDYRRGIGNDIKLMPSKDRGEVFTLAYAAHFGVPFCSSRDGSVISAVHEVKILENVKLIGMEYCLLLGYVQNRDKAEVKTRIKSIYKKYCHPAILKGTVPPKFSEFLNSRIPLEI